VNISPTNSTFVSLTFFKRLKREVECFDLILPNFKQVRFSYNYFKLRKILSFEAQSLARSVFETFKYARIFAFASQLPEEATEEPLIVIDDSNDNLLLSCGERLTYLANAKNEDMLMTLIPENGQKLRSGSA